MSLLTRRRRREPNEDWGFGNQLNRNTNRMVRQDGSFQVARVGGDWTNFSLYHWLISLSWPAFSWVVLCFYMVVNVLFTAIYVFIGDENLSGNAQQFSFWPHTLHAFFFSIQTFTTVGYGGVTPIGFATNLVAGLEALAGILSAALMSGLFFSRFSKAKSSIAFSGNAIIAPLENTHALMFRLANTRNSNLSEVRAQVMIAYLETTEQGEKREYDRLALETERIQMFPLNWTVVHKITEDSPFFGKNSDDWKNMDIEILITISAYDDTFAQTIHSRYSYKWHEIKCGFKFMPMYYTNERGVVILRLDKINELEAITLPPLPITPITI